MASVHKGPDGDWRVQFATADKQRHTIYAPGATHREAETLARNVEALVVAQISRRSVKPEVAEWLRDIPDKLAEKLAKWGLIAKRQDAPGSTTLAAFWAKYLSQRTDLASASRDRIRQTGDRLIAFFGADTPLDEITPDGAKDWRADMLAPPESLAEATVRLHTRNAKSVFTDAVERELILRNPFAKLKSAAIAADRDRYVTAEETTRILAACHSLEWKVLFGLCRLAGLRCPSETHGLLWSDVDWEKRRLAVTLRRKRGEPREVPLVPVLFDLLTAWKAEAPKRVAHVTTLAEGRRWVLHDRFKKILQQAELVPWPDLFQTLRRSAETEFSLRFPQHAVSAWIGHSVEVSRRHYLQVPDSLFEAATAPENNAKNNAVSVGNIPSESEKVPRRTKGKK